jgi:hypothetical protein
MLFPYAVRAPPRLRRDVQRPGKSWLERKPRWRPHTSFLHAALWRLVCLPLQPFSLPISAFQLSSLCMTAATRWRLFSYILRTSHSDASQCSRVSEARALGRVFHTFFFVAALGRFPSSLPLHHSLGFNSPCLESAHPSQSGHLGRILDAPRLLTARRHDTQHLSPTCSWAVSTKLENSLASTPPHLEKFNKARVPSLFAAEGTSLYKSLLHIG